MNTCPACKRQFTKLKKTKCCPNESCNVQLHKIEPGVYIEEIEKYAPIKILELFELRINQANKGQTVFYFQRGKTRAAQLHHCYTLFYQIKEYLSKQPTPLDVPDQAFALMVVAEIMTDDYAKNAHSVRGLTYKLTNACKTVYLSKLSEKKQETLSHSIDLSPKFEVMIF